MGAKKISKNWREEGGLGSGKSLTPAIRPSPVEVTRSEDLPQLMTTKEAAKFLKRHFKYVEELRKEGKLIFRKYGGRYFTTPEFIAQYLETQANV
ncbi:MAG: helix-turn-helix domain-containing protein [Bdellovibrionaceae bacterium]|nr:helix-turn-helix domain-containing protein [Pseudobdellovibrionaceae bacterium]